MYCCFLALRPHLIHCLKTLQLLVFFALAWLDKECDSDDLSWFFTDYCSINESFSRVRHLSCALSWEKVVELRFLFDLRWRVIAKLFFLNHLHFGRRKVPWTQHAFQFCNPLFDPFHFLC